MSKSSLPDALYQQWRGLLRSNKAAADDLYYQEILPIVLTSLDTNPAHQALREHKCQLLVSLMGFSPETTVITAHIVRPERLLIVLSGKAEASYERAYDFLRKYLPNSRIQQEFVDPIDPADIYTKVKAFVERYSSSTGRHVFDVTGGKKIMSATAGQVAWELDMPLCYVEGDYDPDIRRPLPGTERVMLLGNPSKQRQENARDSALAIYRTGNFTRSVEAFLESARLRTDARLEDVAIPLCQCYVAWTNLDFDSLKQRLVELDLERGKPRIQAYLRERGFAQDHLGRQVDALRRVMSREPLARIASYLELAEIYRDMARHDFACLLIYRCMESLVEYGLCRTAGASFQTDQPDYSLFPTRDGEDSLQDRYVKLSKKIDRSRKAETALPSKITMVNGVALLCLLNQIHEREPNSMAIANYVQRIADVAKMRNESVLAHGDRTLTYENCNLILDRCLELARKVLQDEFEPMMRYRTNLKPIALQ